MVVKGDRSKSQFQEDESIPEMFRAKLKDCLFFHRAKYLLIARLPQWL